MAVAIKATVHLVSETGLPEDEVVNTFYFAEPDRPFTSGDRVNVASALIDAYTSNPAGFSVSPSSQLGPQITRDANAHRIEVYEQNALPLARTARNSPFWGSPKYIEQFSIDAPAVVGDGLPSECSAVLSFHGNLTDVPEEAPDAGDAGTAPDRPRARRRGRIYFGPLLAATVFMDNGVPRFGSPGLLAAMGARLVASGLSMNLRWSIYSDQDRTFYPVLGGWCDNAFDIQRRRGEEATVRSTF